MTTNVCEKSNYINMGNSPADNDAFKLSDASGVNVALAIIEAVRNAGVVGAGGGGFPTHVKLSGRADVVIANGAECEPLLENDRHLLLCEPEIVIDGIRAAMAAVGASRGIIAVKKKHTDIIGLLEGKLKNYSNIKLFRLDNYYPAGDEHLLVYETAGRIVPMGGIPLDTGIVVCNVYTLALVAGAIKEGRSFTHRYLTVTGEVRRPAVAKVPIGISIREAILKVGNGFLNDKHRIIVGGPMTGRIEDDLEKPIVKTTGAVIVLLADCRLVTLKDTPDAVSVKRAKSACCQCTFCTELCPRLLLGHRLKPHETMRRLADITRQPESGDFAQSVFLCSECGLCGYYSCSMGLTPNTINAFLKNAALRTGLRPDFKGKTLMGVNPFREFRKVPAERLIKRLGLEKYDRHLPYAEAEIYADKLVLVLKQHTGVPAVPVMRPGERLKAGDVVAVIPENSLGAFINCAHDGIVTAVDKNSITIDCLS